MGNAVNLGMRLRLFFLSFLLCLGFAAQSAYADLQGIPLLLRGVGKTVGAVFQVPAQILMGSTHAFPLGLVGGAVAGTAKAVGGTISGAVDMARGAAPYAKYAVFAI